MFRAFIFSFLFLVYKPSSLALNLNPLHSNQKEVSFSLNLISPYKDIQKENSFPIALYMKLPTGWYSYWSFAGDFGNSPEIVWEKQANVKIKALPFPYPKRKALLLDQKKFYSFIYEKELFIPFKVFVKKSYSKKDLTLKAHVKWFVCKELCLSKEQKLLINLKLGSKFKTQAQQSSLFESQKAFFPKKINLKSDFQIQDKKMFIHFSFKEKIKCLDLLPQSKKDFSTKKPKILSQKSKSCSFELTKSSSDLPKISGLLIYSKNGEKQSALFKSYNKKNSSLFWFILWAFLGGLILNIMPCVLPIIFLKFYNIIEFKSLSKKKMITLNLSYVLGVISSFLFLALFIFISKQAGENLGWGFHLQSSTFVIFLIFLFTVMAFYLLNLISFPIPKASLLFQDQKKWSHFITGVLSTTAASPCTVPFMAPAIGFAFSRSSIEIFVIFFFLGLGLSFPYLLLSFRPQLLKHFPKPGSWAEKLKKIFSIPLFLTALWLLWILYLQVDLKIFIFSLGFFTILFLFLFLQNKIQNPSLKKGSLMAFLFLFIGFLISQKMIQNSFIKEKNIKKHKRFLNTWNWKPFDENKLAFDKQAGKNIFLAFGAEWCLTCKINEKIFKTEEFKTLTDKNNIQLYYGDWTTKDGKIISFMENYFRQGVPFYIFFKGEESHFLFPTLLFKESFLKKLQHLSCKDCKY